MYTGRGYPGIVDIMGYAPMASYPVSITTGGNTVPADFRLLEYYQKKVSWTNTAAARFEQVFVESDPTHAGTEKELWVFLPKDPEAFTHDVDGNLLQDGRWTYGWDGENRLIWMESRTDLPTAMPRQRVEFGYDFMSRRNVKRMDIPVAVAEIPGGPLDEPQTVGSTTSVIDGATASVAGPSSDAAPETLPAWAVSAPVGWSQVGLSKYVWDGWNLLAELDITDASVRTFAWGLDLSGSEQGAGGIGGLVLGWTRANGSMGGEVNGTGGNTLRYVFDGNGNVMAALDDLGRVRAKYEYGPFGETLTSEGDLAADNPIRWSTKYTDGESGLVYYGYRYYNAGTGRWLNRDPKLEKGSLNLASFAKNDPTGRVDPLGLCCFEPPETSRKPDRDHPDSWYRLSGQDPGLYPLRYRFLGSFCEPAAFASTFLENVTPDVEVKFGFYKRIDKTTSCCKDGTVHKCVSTGFEIIFGLKAKVDVSYNIEAGYSFGDTGDKCPIEGRYHKIEAGMATDLRVGRGVSISFKGGAVINPNGELWKLGSLEFSLDLPNGIGCSAEAKTDDQQAAAIVVSLQASLLKIGGGVDVGSYATWTVTCEDTKVPCACEGGAPSNSEKK